MNLQNINFYILSRLSSAATATGYAKIHAKEQADLLDKAFTI
jgi:2-oxoglutarate dehydrogenase E1 component